MSNRQKGFTLVELMVVVLIVGILAGIAVPSYRAYVLRVNRADAKIGLTSLAQQLERCYTRQNKYRELGPGGCNVNTTVNAPLSGTANYAITGDVQDQRFTLTATRVNGQVDDTACGNFTLDNNGVQNVVGATKTKEECWR